MMQVCKRLERSNPEKRQATVQGSCPCTLHHTGVAQTSGSSEHPGPCLGHQRPLPPIRPHVNTKTWRELPCLTSRAAFVPQRLVHGANQRHNGTSHDIGRAHEPYHKH